MAASTSPTANSPQASVPASYTPEQRLDRLSFRVEKSLRYHQRRRGFFDAIHNFIMFGVLLSGSAAFGGIFPAVAGAVAAILGALDLVFQFSHKARDHQSLYQRFSALNIELQAIKAVDIVALEQVERRRLEIEADEPPIYWALDADCDSEVCIAWGRDKTAGVIQLTRNQWIFMNFYRFDRTRFAPRKVP